MRILLISPKKSGFADLTPGWLRIPQLSLSILSALTPPQHEVITVEEEFERLPLDEDWDLVGISTMTATAPRAYELASLFRRNGAKVVIGGIHPSVLSDEAAQFADSVVVGEAEGVWEEVVDDARRNRLKRFYRNFQPDISKSPIPLRKRSHFVFGLPPYVLPIMASRGCPNDCEFCCVHTVYGRRQRFIPIETILQDIKESGSRRLMFLDDNIGGVRSYAMQLFKALRPLNLKWLAQATVRFILDKELFTSAVHAGLKGLFVGVESVEKESLEKMRKSLGTIELYEKAIKRCHASGVAFHASLIFGLDEQTPRTFERTLDFLLRNSVPSISANILTPYPGTRLFERLNRERRILHTNWSFYDHTTVCFQPKNMSPEELSERYLNFRKDFFSFSSIVRRSYAQLRVAPLIFIGMNLAYRKTTKLLKEHFSNYFRWLRSQKRETVFSWT
ncbi:MAG: B12-binding domain-containing radical SAM protein [Planctomycetota bacterium]|nr:B12-binding domain-containing radical SAM protein [Planctomycetota bacterium]